MPLPQQVIDRLSKEPPKTPGWSFGIFTFSGGILFLTVLLYFGLTLGYEPYLDSQIAMVNTQITTLAKSISADNQTKFIVLYSEIANLKTVLGNHIALSRFFSWLEKNTEANVYYPHIIFSSKNQIALSGVAKSEADVGEQLAIFEADPAVTNMVLSSVSISDTGSRLFSVTLTVNPASMLLASP